MIKRIILAFLLSLLFILVPAYGQTSVPITGNTLPVHGAIILLNKFNITQDGFTGLFTTFPGKHTFFFTVNSIAPMPITNSGEGVGFQIQMNDPASNSFINFCMCQSKGTLVTPTSGTLPIMNLDLGGSWRIAYFLLNSATSASISIGVSY